LQNTLSSSIFGKSKFKIKSNSRSDSKGKFDDLMDDSFKKTEKNKATKEKSKFADKTSELSELRSYKLFCSFAKNYGK